MEAPVDGLDVHGGLGTTTEGDDGRPDAALADTDDLAWAVADVPPSALDVSHDSGTGEPGDVDASEALDAAEPDALDVVDTGDWSDARGLDMSQDASGDAPEQTEDTLAGACDGVYCMSLDPCHVAGICDPATGLCSNPAAPDGTGCDDGDPCTQTDTCQAGACQGSNPVVCVAAGLCEDAGTCNPITGACSHPAKVDGTACDDGNACTQTDTCQDGACQGSNPVVCVAADPCHGVGSCDPSTGVCSQPAVADGSACSDGNACTQIDGCQNGACVGTDPVVCTPPDQCHMAGQCDSGTGQCGDAPPHPDGTPCDGGNVCTTGDACFAGVCTPGPKKPCSDGNACTLDECIGPKPLGGVLCGHVNAPAGTPCGTGLGCYAGKCIDAAAATFYGKCKGAQAPAASGCDMVATFEGCCNELGIVIYCMQGNTHCFDCSNSPACGWDTAISAYWCGTDGGAGPVEFPKACP